MGALLRLVGWLSGLLLVSAVLAGVFVAFYVDPNDFKGVIARELAQRAGRPVEIPGNVRLSVFPWLGFETGRVTVGNPPGFAEPTFASVERADLRVKLLPLLRREVETDTVVVHGLDLRLVRDREGRTNWQDLVGQPPTTAPTTSPDSSPAAAPLALAVGGLDLRGARISWTDEATGRRLRIEDLDLQTGAIAPGNPVPLALALRASDSGNGLRAEVEVRGRLDTDPTRRQYRLRDLLLEARIVGPKLPEGGIDLTVRGQVDTDPEQQTAKAGPLHLTLPGVEADAAAVIDWPGGELRYSASLDARDARVRSLLEGLARRPLGTADPNAFERLSLGARIAGTGRSATVSPLNLRVDDSAVEGQVEILDFAGPTIRFDLVVDRLDLDRYLPPRAAPPGEAATDGVAQGAPAAPAIGGPAPASEAEPGGAPPADPGPVPAPDDPGPATAGTVARPAPAPGWPLTADLQGRLHVDQLHLRKVQVTDAGVTLAAKGGLVRLDPLEARLYGGSYRGRPEIDTRRAPVRVRLDERLSGVEVAPLLEALAGKASLSGRADLTFRAEMNATDGETILHTLAGDGRFSLRDGAIRGLDLGRAARLARARLRGEPAEDGQAPAETDFTEVHGSFRIAQGVLRNDDLYGKSPLLRLEGRGTADLPRGEIDYRLTAFVVGTTKGQGGKDLEDLRGVPIPVVVSGELRNPDYRVDLDEALKGLAREELRQKVEDSIDRRLGGDAGEKAKELLRGLFR
ncbi:MAG: AsmA family protein [Gammaproteobacteria bacterium]|jgi:AsmA protein|nr:AsmA family protein [Gammaproteobacteria bacterium]